MKHLKWIIPAAVLLLIIVVYWQLYTPASSSGEPVALEIATKESFEDVVADLNGKNLARNQTLLKIYGRLTGLDTQVKAGRYRLDSKLSPVNILNFLSHPEYGEMSVTIPEGYSVYDIDKKLAKLSLIKEGEFTGWAMTLQFAPLGEGYLFPDTYFVFAKNFRSQDLGGAMITNFNKKVREGLEEQFSASKRSFSDIIIMASILEKEVNTKADLPIVAGILWKRLDNKWPLQADATLLYGKEDRSNILKYKELDSEYNTYTRQGLPLTPICNPGLETIKAALNPVESPYWFYLTSKDGKVIYAKTNEEHNQNKRKYL